jgi:hypothetical protein
LFTAFMRRISRWAFVAWVIVASGGCAAVTGLDSLQEQDCAPNCGDAHAADVASGDRTAPDVQENETSTGDDSTTSESSTVEAAAETGAETGHEASTEASTKDGGEAGADASDAAKETGVEAGPEAGTEAGTDAPPDVAVDTGTDAPETGCGTTNTLQNCGACGQACSTGGTNGVKASGAGCTGTTCLYQCSTGFLDCNSSVGYDPDGCECDTSLATTAACCGTACPIAHITGTNLPGAASSNFYDCTAAGTFTSQLATDACTAYFGTPGDCFLPGQCTNASDAGTGDFVVCGSVTATSECVCWEYQGPNVGKVTAATGVELGNCICPGSSGTGVTTYSWH